MLARYEPPGTSRDGRAELEGEELRKQASRARLKRMRSGLGWSTAGATIIEHILRSGLSQRASVGLNLLIFGALALVIYFSLRGSIKRTDTTSFAWRMKSPWQLIYWPAALIIILLLQVRFL